MTLFGTTLDAGQISGLAFLLCALVLWIAALGRERGYARWFKTWEAERKARRDTELGVPPPTPRSDAPKKGPWG